MTSALFVILILLLALGALGLETGIAEWPAVQIGYGVALGLTILMLLIRLFPSTACPGGVT